MATQRLQATRLDEEQWSFLFRTEGSLGLVYCPWSVLEDYEFDGDLDGLELPWSDERIEEIEEGDDPTEAELAEWRRATGRQLADHSEWAVPAWIVPIRLDEQVAGYALFLCLGEGEDEPHLEGIHETVAEARSALAAQGAVAAD
ncbi:hypothetical protein [Mesorhizobium sp. 1B3]|uniref:hypothetical protein n=1 Tax=Mesorhizobium sp. 1B3 TaxID=3243599 RepID=UPI003D9996D3